MSPAKPTNPGQSTATTGVFHLQNSSQPAARSSQILTNTQCCCPLLAYHLLEHLTPPAAIVKPAQTPLMPCQLGQPPRPHCLFRYPPPAPRPPHCHGSPTKLPLSLLMFSMPPPVPTAMLPLRVSWSSAPFSTPAPSHHLHRSAGHCCHPTGQQPPLRGGFLSSASL